jgi:hypothetical protein
MSVSGIELVDRGARGIAPLSLISIAPSLEAGFTSPSRKHHLKLTRSSNCLRRFDF